MSTCVAFGKAFLDQKADLDLSLDANREDLKGWISKAEAAGCLKTDLIGAFKALDDLDGLTGKLPSFITGRIEQALLTVVRDAILRDIKFDGDRRIDGIFDGDDPSEGNYF